MMKLHSGNSFCGFHIRIKAFEHRLVRAQAPNLNTNLSRPLKQMIILTVAHSNNEITNVKNLNYGIHFRKGI